MINIEIITLDHAYQFYTMVNGKRGKVQFTNEGLFYGAHTQHGDNTILVGIVSVQQIGKWTRVKNMLVKEDWQDKGVFEALINEVSHERDCSTYAWEYEVPAFLQAGYQIFRVQTNGVHIMYRPFSEGCIKDFEKKQRALANKLAKEAATQ